MPEITVMELSGIYPGHYYDVTGKVLATGDVVVGMKYTNSRGALVKMDYYRVFGREYRFGFRTVVPPMAEMGEVTMYAAGTPWAWRLLEFSVRDHDGLEYGNPRVEISASGSC
jgi:hypothetical protein